MTFFWHNDSSTLYAGTPEQPGEMLGWCERNGNQHKEIGWFATVVGVGLIPDTERKQWYWPDECMARQAVVDAVRRAPNENCPDCAFCATYGVAKCLWHQEQK